MRKAVINVCTNNGGYPQGQKRLAETIKDADFYGYVGEHKVGAPPHNKIPYAFKPFAIEHLRKKGYDLVLWCDASMIAVKPLFELFKIIELDGYLMEESGHYLGRWCNDKALRNMGITREQAMKIPMYSAGMTGLNLKDETAIKFLDDWLNFAKDGETFVGDWKDHRHDMSVASFLAHKYNMKFQRGGTYLSYIGKAYGKPSETSVFHLIGI
jgi:hypothetical protein